MNMFKAIGLMSGTSCDGIDIALLETDGESAIDFLHGYTQSYSNDFTAQLKSIHLKSYAEILMLEKQLTIQHSHVVNKFISQANINIRDINCIGFHGHTVLHDPILGLTSQIGNPHLLVERTKISVVHDFRKRDMAAGGNGAPLVPIFHQALAKKYGINAVLFLNIGGVSNGSYIYDDILIASDVGTGGALLDDFIFRNTGAAYDKNGEIARSGHIDWNIVQKFADDEFFSMSPPKALDRNYFNKIDTSSLNLEDGAATLTHVTAFSVQKYCQSIKTSLKKIIVTGGGRKNLFLLESIRQLTGLEVIDIDAIGVNGDLLEAYAFAYLSVRVIKSLPISYHTTTGVLHPCVGGSLCLI